MNSSLLFGLITGFAAIHARYGANFAFTAFHSIRPKVGLSAPKIGFTHFSAKSRIASRYFGFRCSLSGSSLSGSSVTSGMSSGGVKNASTTPSTAANEASAAAVASPRTATSGVLPCASQSAIAFFSAADGSALSSSASCFSTSSSFFWSASDG